MVPVPCAPYRETAKESNRYMERSLTIFTSEKLLRPGHDHQAVSSLSVSQNVALAGTNTVLTCELSNRRAHTQSQLLPYSRNNSQGSTATIWLFSPSRVAFQVFNVPCCRGATSRIYRRKRKGIETCLKQSSPRLQL